MGVRLEPNSSEESSNAAKYEKRTPLALRKTSALGLLKVVSAPGQVRFPSTMNTDASLRLPCMGSQGSEVAIGSRKADGCLLLRLVGTTSRAHSAAEQKPCPESKSGLLPLLHVAHPRGLIPGVCPG